MRDIKGGLDAMKTANPNFVEIAAREVFRFRDVKSVADPLPARAWTKAHKAARRADEGAARLPRSACRAC